MKILAFLLLTLSPTWNAPLIEKNDLELPTNGINYPTKDEDGVHNYIEDVDQAYNHIKDEDEVHNHIEDEDGVYNYTEDLDGVHNHSDQFRDGRSANFRKNTFKFGDISVSGNVDGDKVSIGSRMNIQLGAENQHSSKPLDENKHSEELDSSNLPRDADRDQVSMGSVINIEDGAELQFHSEEPPQFSPARSPQTKGCNIETDVYIAAGNDVKQMPSSGREECSSECAYTDGCIAWTMRTSDSHCWLKSDNSSKGNGEGWITGTKECGRKAGCNIETDVYIAAGNDVKQMSSSGREECSSACAYTDGCVSWSMRTSDSHCWLKSDDSSKGNGEGWITGTKECGRKGGFSDLVGNGACRGAGWNSFPNDGFPRKIGYVSQSKCEDICRSSRECSAYDIARQREDKSWDCHHFGHKDIIADTQIDGFCYKIIGRKAGFSDLVGNGACRGSGWNSFTNAGFPRGIGYVSQSKCEEICISTRDCSAYDIARQREDKKWDCYLFGHKDIIADTHIEGFCYKIIL